MRAYATILTAAILRAVSAKLANRTLLTAIEPSVAGLADACSIHWVTRSLILAAARQPTLGPIKKWWAGPRASVAIPASLALALPSPRVAHDSVLLAALANLITAWPIQFIYAGSASTPGSCESREADTVPV